MMSRCTKKTRRRQQQHWKRQHLIFSIRNGDNKTINFQLGENNPPNASDGHSSNSNSCPRWNDIIDTITVGVTNRTNNAAHTRSSTDRNSHRKACFLSRIRHFPTGERNHVLITPAAMKYCVMLILFIGCVATCPSEALKSTSFATSLTIQPSYRNNILSKVGFVPSIPNFFSHETNNRRGIKTQQTLLFLTSESANDSQSFHYALEVEDAKGRSKRSVHKLEMEHLKGRSTRSMQKKEKKNKKRARKQSSNGKKQPNPVGGPSTRDRKKRHRRSKLITPETTEMPPWLAQYENDNLLDPFIQEEVGNKIHYEHDTEPQYQNTQHNEISRDLSAIYQESSISNKHNTNNMKEFQNAKAQMQRLQLAMSGIFYRPQSTAATSHPDAISYFTPSEIHEVLDSIRVASNSNPNLMSGCADFLYLMLTLEEEGVLSSDFLSDPWTNDDTDDDINAKEETKGVGTNLGHEPHSIMTRDVLVAAAFHYCDCVRARKAGVYNYVRRAMEASLDLRKLEQRHELWLPPAVSDGEDEIEVDQGLGAHPTTQTVNPQIDDSAMLARHTTSVRSGKVAVEEYGEESAKIAAGAARLKRAEIMATTLNANESTKLKDSSKPSTVVSSSASPSQTLKRNSKASNDDSAILRSFLVSLSEDWRSLVIRSAACLYRLRGIADADEDANQGRNSSRPTMLSTTSMRTARDALRIYGKSLHTA